MAAMPETDRRRRSLLRHPRRSCRCRARRADRRGRTADLPDLDLRAGRRRQATPRLRVRAVAESHPGAARARDRDARGRPPRVRLRVAVRRRPRRSPSSPRRATRWSSGTTSTAARTAISRRSARAPASRRRTSTWPPVRTCSGRRCRNGRGSCGSRRRPIRCSRPSISPRSPRPSSDGRRKVAGGR